MRFDLDWYKLTAERLRWDDLDLEGFATNPLGEDDLRCLRYMHDVEYHTACYLRDRLSSWARVDSRSRR